MERSTPETTGHDTAGWTTHHDALLARAMRLCGDRDAAQDLVQDTYVRALTCEARFVRGTNAGAWLTTILRRRFIDDWRRRQRTTPVALSEVEEVAVVPEEEAEAEWVRISEAELEAAIHTLAPSFRSVFQLHAVEHRSYREIGAQLGIPTATVGTRLARARQKLKKVLLTG